MSGGHWNHCGGRIARDMERISNDEDARTYWPVTCALFGAIGEALREAEHQMDWALSGDTLPEDVSDAAMTAAILDVLNAVLKAAPDAWFPRGKWATIQTILERATKPGQSPP